MTKLTPIPTPDESLIIRPGNVFAPAKIMEVAFYLDGKQVTAREMAIHDIAKTCHEVNRAYCESIGDNSQVFWLSAPEWQRQSAIKGVEFALANPSVTPADMHQSWSDEKIAAGWVHGEIKDANQKTHPCLVPYDQLPITQRVKDSLFLAVVDSMRDCLTICGYL